MMKGPSRPGEVESYGRPDQQTSAVSLAQFAPLSTRIAAALTLFPPIYCSLLALIHGVEPNALADFARASAPLTGPVMRVLSQGSRAESISQARLIVDDLIISVCILAFVLQAVLFLVLVALYRRHIGSWIASKYRMSVAEWCRRSVGQWGWCIIIVIMAMLDLRLGGYLMHFFEKYIDDAVLPLQSTLFRVGGVFCVLMILSMIGLQRLLYFVFSRWADRAR